MIVTFIRQCLTSLTVTMSDGIIRRFTEATLMFAVILGNSLVACCKKNTVQFPISQIVPWMSSMPSVVERLSSDGWLTKVRWHSEVLGHIEVLEVILLLSIL
jgi:hypothetical protein